MATIRLKRGFDLNLKGGISINDEIIASTTASKDYAIIPDDFPGIVPRLEKKEGEQVQAGEPIYHDKTYEQIKVTSPVNGTIKQVVRGERRKILRIDIEASGTPTGTATMQGTSGSVKDKMLQSGLWATMRQRPYDVVPNPDATPRDIFVTGFDSAPLAPSLIFLLGEDKQYIEAGVQALASLTTGKVYIGLRRGDEGSINAPSATFNTFIGPHPAGNAGVQAANVKPVNKDETIWTLDLITLAKIGKLIATGTIDYTTTVAVTGEQVNKPGYLRTIIGSSIKDLLGKNVKDNGLDNRIISGNVLTGVNVGIDGYLQAPYRQITVIPEVSKKNEFMGWASLNPNRFSIYRDFTTWLAGKLHKPTSFDARIKGGERAIVMTGEYDRMLPMDIYCEFLIKAIIAFDIDKMEQLGIYEIAPEDFALAEYADTSKLELQKIIRQGLDRMRKEMA